MFFKQFCIETLQGGVILQIKTLAGARFASVFFQMF
jgi:hypothetical protein